MLRRRKETLSTLGEGHLNAISEIFDTQKTRILTPLLQNIVHDTVSKLRARSCQQATPEHLGDFTDNFRMKASKELEIAMNDTRLDRLVRVGRHFFSEALIESDIQLPERNTEPLGEIEIDMLFNTISPGALLEVTMMSAPGQYEYLSPDLQYSSKQGGGERLAWLGLGLNKQYPYGVFISADNEVIIIPKEALRKYFMVVHLGKAPFDIPPPYSFETHVMKDDMCIDSDGRRMYHRLGTDVCLLDDNLVLSPNSIRSAPDEILLDVLTRKLVTIPGGSFDAMQKHYSTKNHSV